MLREQIENLRAQLDRHEQRRREGVPTISVLAGPINTARAVVREAAERAARELVMLGAADQDDVVFAWIEPATRMTATIERALSIFIGPMRDRAQALRELGPATERDREALFSAGVVSNDRDALDAARIIVLAACGRISSLRASINAVFCDDALRTAVSFARVIDLRRAPAIALEIAPHDAERWFTSSARAVVDVTFAVPEIAIAITAPRSAIDACFEREPESRHRAALREGVIDLPIELAPEEPRGGRAMRAGERGEASRRRLESLHATSLLADFARALDATREPPADVGQDNVARSLAEKLLFDVLACHPDTAGLFRLNALLDAQLGGRAVEVDLLSRACAIAIEVDGYHHFRDAERYRRDRRKDTLLQRHGHLVLRFLAIDVVERLDEVLDVVLSTVRERKSLR